MNDKHKMPADRSDSAADRKAASPARKPRHRLRHWGIALLIVAILLGGARAALPWFVRNYVNRTLDRSPEYTGTIGPIGIHLWRGAYSIRDVRVSKRIGDVPVPLFACQRLDFAIQWKNLIHRKIVGRILMQQPEINFVDSPSEGESQTGTGGPWLQMLRDLFPFKINSAIIQDGSVHFRSYQSKKPVDVYLSHFDGTIDNLGNIKNDLNPLPATVHATAMAMDQAKLELIMTLDPFSYHPTFHLLLRLIGLDVTKINDLAITYGKFDFKRGFFDLVVEADSREGVISGYVKPLFRDLKVFSLRQDIKGGDILQVFWQALVGAVAAVFKNQSHDQFGTVIPFSGEVGGTTSTDILSTIGNVLRNAFVRAYLPRPESGSEEVGGMTFSAPDISAPISPGDTGEDSQTAP